VSADIVCDKKKKKVVLDITGKVERFSILIALLQRAPLKSITMAVFFVQCEFTLGRSTVKVSPDRVKTPKDKSLGNDYVFFFYYFLTRVTIQIIFLVIEKHNVKTEINVSFDIK